MNPERRTAAARCATAAGRSGCDCHFGGVLDALLHKRSEVANEALRGPEMERIVLCNERMLPLSAPASLPAAYFTGYYTSCPFRPALQEPSLCDDLVHNPFCGLFLVSPGQLATCCNGHTHQNASAISRVQQSSVPGSWHNVC